MSILGNSQRDQYFNEKAQLFKLLSSPVKLKILQYVSFAPRTVEDCSKKIDQSIQNTSLHLISLEKAGILEKSKIKNFHYYSLKNEDLGSLVDQALEFGGQTLLTEQDIYNEEMNVVAHEVKEKKVLLIDLRSFEEVSYLPLPYALHFDGDTTRLKEFIKTLPKATAYVLICKGKLCERLSSAIKQVHKSPLIKALPYSAEDLKRFCMLLTEVS